MFLRELDEAIQVHGYDESPVGILSNKMVVRQMLDKLSAVKAVSWVARRVAKLGALAGGALGAATLVLELRDSETGSILARSVDRRAAETIGGTFQRSSSVTNAAEVRRLIRHWAVRLREGLVGFAQ